MAEKKPSLTVGKDIPPKVGIISDIHGNYLALIKALQIFKKYNINKYIFLGDAIGYIPSLKALDIIYKNSRKFLCIKGNHEEMFIKKDTCPIKNKIYLHSLIRTRISNDAKNYINSWETKLTIKNKEKSFLFIHGSPKDYNNGYVYPDTDLSQFSVEDDIIFMGHSHWAFDRTFNKKRFINAGSCGLPRDNGKFGSIGIFDFATLKYITIRFDISETYSILGREYPEIDKSVLELRHREKVEIRGEQIV